MSDGIRLAFCTYDVMPMSSAPWQQRKQKVKITSQWISCVRMVRTGDFWHHHHHHRPRRCPCGVMFLVFIPCYWEIPSNLYNVCKIRKSWNRQWSAIAVKPVICSSARQWLTGMCSDVHSHMKHLLEMAACPLRRNFHCKICCCLCVCIAMAFHCTTSLNKQSSVTPEQPLCFHNSFAN